MQISKITHGCTRPKGFRVITVGTGAPHYNPDRACPCTVVQYKDTSFIVDLGYGSVARMLNAGVNAFDMNNVLITHYHIDHTLDYGFFMTMGWRNRNELRLVGPEGAGKLHKSFYDLYANQLNLFPGRSVRIDEIEDGVCLEIDGVHIEAKSVPHAIGEPAVAYKFIADGKTVIVPGDMRYNEGFIEFSENADIVVYDANTAPSKFRDELFREVQKEREALPDDVKRKMEKPGGEHHATLEELAEMAEKASVKAMVLTHFTKDVYIGDTISAVSKIYHGKIIAGEDMLSVEPDN